MSLFITFEGGEGCGKSVQTKALYQRLQKLAIPVVVTREPGGTRLGDIIARTVKWTKSIKIPPITELLLFNASRSQLITGVIQPSLKEEKVVICDRFADSTIAYQSYGRGLDIEMVKMVNNIATQGLKPDITFLLDMPVEEALARKKGKQDRFEQEALAFHQRVRDGYLQLATMEPQRWLVLDATQPKEKISEIIWEKVEQLLTGRDLKKNE